MSNSLVFSTSFRKYSYNELRSVIRTTVFAKTNSSKTTGDVVSIGLEFIPANSFADCCYSILCVGTTNFLFRGC